jgi:hypothetical protein
MRFEIGNVPRAVIYRRLDCHLVLCPRLWVCRKSLICQKVCRLFYGCPLIAVDRNHRGGDLRRA